MAIRIIILTILLAISGSAQPFLMMPIQHASGPSYPVGFYVSASGSDANNGTTPTTPFADVPYALTNSTSGSTIYLMSNLGITNGYVKHPNTLTSYGGTYSLYWTNGNGLTISNISSVTISNVNWIGTNCNNGIAFYNYAVGESQQYVFNCTIAGCGQKAVQLPSLIQGGFDVLYNCGPTGTDFNCGVSNCVINNSYCDGVICWSDNNNLPFCHTNFFVMNCAFTNIFGNTNAAYVSGIPIAIGMATNWVTDYNMMYHYGVGTTNSSGGPGAIVAVYSYGGLMESNTAAYGDATPPGVDGIAFDCDIGTGQNKVMFNTASNCQGAGLFEFDAAGTNIFAFNVVMNCNADGNTAAIYHNGTSLGSTFANNTVMGIGTLFGENTSIFGNTNKCANNIFYQDLAQSANILVLAKTTNWLVESNVYYALGNVFYSKAGTTSYSTFSSFQSTFPQAGISANPLFYNFVLGLSPTNQLVWSNSPAIGYGAPLNTIGVTSASDFGGYATPSGHLNAGAWATNLLVGCSPLSTNIWAYWPLTEGSGTTAYDISGYSNSLAFVGSPTWTSGTLGGGVTFNGTSQGLAANLANSPIQEYAPMSIAAWVNVTTTSGAQVIMAGWDSHETYIIENTLAYVQNTSGSELEVTYSAIPTGTHRIVITCDGTTTKAYIDGSSVGTTGSPFAGSPGNAFTTIGYDDKGSPTDYFPGSVYEANVWGFALTSTEVTLDYNSGSGRKPPFQ